MYFSLGSGKDAEKMMEAYSETILFMQRKKKNSHHHNKTSFSPSPQSLLDYLLVREKC